MMPPTDLPGPQVALLRRFERGAWLSAGLSVASFVAIDLGLVLHVESAAVRMTVRWLIFAGVCLPITGIATRVMLRQLARYMRSEQAALAEREALLVAERVARAEAAQAREQALEAAAEKAAIIDQLSDAVLVADASGRIVQCNRAAAALFEVEPDQLIGIFSRDLPGELHQVDGLLLEAGDGPLSRAVAGETVAAEYQVRTRAGRERWVWGAAAPLRDQQGRIRGGTVVLRNMTDRKRAEQALAHQALHDALTGLPNRVLLRDRLEQAIARARRDQSTVGLLLMDLDHFKDVNDTLGHSAGDALLQQVGRRLRGALRQADTIARLGGDEFAAILPNTTPDGARRVGEHLLRILQAPFELEGQPVVVGASIGGALFPDHSEHSDALMRHADVAMYVAKRSSSGFALYASEQDRHSPDRLTLISELRSAVDRGELVLHYQPKLDLRTGAVAGVEALVRWQHPVRGLMVPDQFIAVAEQASLIGPLTAWVLQAALQQARAWREAGLDLPIAVNLSMRNLSDAQVPDVIADLLRTCDSPPGRLCVEITESSLMADPDRAQRVLDRLRSMGIRVAIDDFGTGYSSLAHLKRLPVDELKIDRSFVRDMATDESDLAIVRATIELAHSLGLRVVAEGTEDSASWRLLEQLGCDEAQGYYLSRPLRGQDVPGWLYQRQTRGPRAAPGPHGDEAKAA